MSAHRPPDWLYPLLGDTPGNTLLVGGVGHLLLNHEEEVVICAALEERVLPLLRDMAGARPITLFTGLAPGADALLMDCASRWCTRQQVPLRKVGICPVPPSHLAADWISHAESMGGTLSTTARQRVQADVLRVHADCETVIPLYHAADDDPVFADALVRQLHYRQLAAALAEYSDVLVAILHEDHVGHPGGTAEVVAWRQNPAKIPEKYSTRRSRAARGTDAGLIVINPMPARVTMSASGSDVQVRKTLSSAQEAIQKGNELLANDILYRALQQGLKHPDLYYLRVQSLAGIGSSDLALREYEELAPAPAERDERWITLKARIKKDFGLRSGSRRLFLESAEHYLDAWRRFGSSYSAINAASMFALGQDWPRAHGLAKKALAATAYEAGSTVEESYFIAATSAEASLILADLPAVHRHLTEANQCEVAIAHRRRTLRQMQRLCSALGISPAILAPLKLPPLIVLRRLGLAQLKPIEAMDAPLIPEFPANASLFVGLCDSFDLVLAEQLLQRGHPLQLVLPYRAERLIEATLARLGARWAERLERCLAAAARVHAERGFLEQELSWAAGNVTERALGLALLTASRAGGSLQIIDVDPRQQPPRIGAPTCFEAEERLAQKALSRLYAEEPAATAPSGRRMVGLIFADFAGFQRLEDTVLPQFWNGPMRAIAQLLARHGDRVLLKNTWGDGLHVVTKDADTAASIMADIQHYMTLQRLKPEAPLADLTLRIAGHYAPAYEGFDSIYDARTYFGTQLSLAARIEPVTPPGQIYATEAFAARLAVENSEQFVLEYAGEIELAKRFGAYRLYSLRRLKG